MTPRREWTITLTAATGIIFGLAGSAAAQDTWPSIEIRGAAFLADVTSTLRIDSTIGQVGTTIDFEDDLGFDTNANTYFLAGTWRISRRNQIQVDYVNIGRDVTRALTTRTITFRDETFTVDSEIDAFLDTWYLSVYYGFAFVANPRVELGAMIGVTAMRIHTGIGLSAQGAAGNVSRDLRENAEFTAPIPLPGAFLNVRPHPRLVLNGSVRVIKAGIDEVDGTMWEARAGGDVVVLPHLAIGAAYYFNSSDLERDASLFDGRVEYRFSGPQLSVALTF